ncbi:MAG: TVP38/TMEM64 family protein [Bradyrhizobium sp.]
MRRFIRAWGAWSAVGAVALMALHSFLPLPAEVIAMGNGMIFGPWLGTALTWIGAMIGAILSFALARVLGRPLARRVLPERHWQRLDALPTRPGTLLLVRFLPIVSFNLVNYAAGILHVHWWTFSWTTAIGILPLTIAMALLGNEMTTAPWWLWAAVTSAILALWLLLRRHGRTAV